MGQVDASRCLLPQHPSRAGVAGGGGGGVAAEDGPVHIWAQILTTDGAVGGALDLGAAFGGNLPNAANPMVNCRWRNTKLFRKNCHAASNLNRFFYRMNGAHAR